MRICAFVVKNCSSSRKCCCRTGGFIVKDAFLWFEHHNINYPLPKALPAPIFNPNNELEIINVIRSTYYTSICGDLDKIRELEEKIWNVGMQPCVFKKTCREEKAKGVDIALTKDMLVHAFLDNFDIAVLVTGDGDYVPLVEEVKH
ncbi:MAG: NYN domain-containing protein [Bryobacteraceae bacterium]